MTEPTPAISTTRLTKQYTTATAVDRLDLRVEQGEIYGLLGPNGAGKTTTILMLLGLTEPTSGKVRVVGLDPTRDPLGVKRQVGYLPDAVGFYSDLTARQNLRYSGRLNRLSRQEASDRCEQLLSDVGLTERADEAVGKYSRGMLQRLGIADALLKDPSVLVLDEPTLGLDPTAADQVVDLIRSLAADRHVTVLLCSHQLSQVQAICHRIGIFVRGRLVVSGSMEELSATHGGRYVIEVGVARGNPEHLLRRVEGVVDVRRADGAWLVGAQADVRESIAASLVASDMVVTHLRRQPEELSAIYRRHFAEESVAAH